MGHEVVRLLSYGPSRLPFALNDLKESGCRKFFREHLSTSVLDLQKSSAYKMSGLQTILREKFAVWTSNGSSVEEVGNNFKNIVCESMERFVPHNILT